MPRRAFSPCFSSGQTATILDRPSDVTPSAVYLSEPTSEALGAVLRASRKSAGLRVADAAVLVQKTTQAVYAWETGKAAIPAVMAICLLRAYGAIGMAWPSK